MIPITLTREESRLCREAVKLALSEGLSLPFPDAGEQRFSRAQWCDLARYLRFCATDFEVERELTERKKCDAIAWRIDGVIERYDLVNERQPVAVAEVTERQGALF